MQVTFVTKTPRGEERRTALVHRPRNEAPFAPVLVNGWPIEVAPEVDDYDACLCRRCLIHDDPGGCVA